MHFVAELAVVIGSFRHAQSPEIALRRYAPMVALAVSDQGPTSPRVDSYLSM